jgi:hypothetical protein
MAGTANLSSTFAITFIPSNTAATTIVPPPGLSFRISSISANNTTGGALTVTVTDGTNNITDGAQSIPANSAAFAELLTGNLEITAGENLVVTVNGTGLSPITINCVATSGGAALSAT